MGGLSKEVEANIASRCELTSVSLCFGCRGFTIFPMLKVGAAEPQE